MALTALGTFHPGVATPVLNLLERRGIEWEAEHSLDRVEVLVDAARRDDLRAELAVNWPGLVNSLDADGRAAVVSSDSDLPGWFDPPTSAWVDRHGQIKVDAGPEAEAAEEANRTWGPMITGIGAVVAAAGWLGRGSLFLLLAGLTIAVIGLFLPR